jgi:hypothetical protein
MFSSSWLPLAAATAMVLLLASVSTSDENERRCVLDKTREFQLLAKMKDSSITNEFFSFLVPVEREKSLHCTLELMLDEVRFESTLDGWVGWTNLSFKKPTIIELNFLLNFYLILGPLG